MANHKPEKQNLSKVQTLDREGIEEFLMDNLEADGHSNGHTPTQLSQSEVADESVQFLVPSEKTNAQSDADVDGSDGDSETEDRTVWGRKLEYVLSMMGYCVGLGNFFRFPYVCIRNGGGAFLIPFFTCLFLCGMPLFFLEVALGQFVSKSALHIWCICPLFKGVGIAMNMLCVIFSWYNVMILAWTLIYLFNSVKSPQPWTLCGQSWNTENCVPLKGHAEIALNDSGVFNSTDNGRFSVVNVTDLGVFSNISSLNGSLVNETSINETVFSSTEEFWTNHVLSLSSGFEDMGGIVWHALGAMVLSSLIVFLCIMKGVTTVGKVVYVTATLPYILITVLLIKGITLPGSTDGILFYVRPDFSKLVQVGTWIEASVQVFYSLGASWGNLITMASYNKFKNNCMMDAVLLSVVCEGTSVFAGLATFTILGHLAYRLSVPVSNFSKSGAGLVFVVYPEAISYLPVPQLWGVLFFVMLFTLGLDSQFVTLETVLTTICDTWPKLIRKREILFKAIALGALCVLSIPFATQGGMYLFQLSDWYTACFTVMANALIECIVVGWIYGTDRFLRDISLMIGKRPPFIFSILWKFVTPGFIGIACVVTLVYYKPPVYEGYTYGTGAIAFGWILALCTFLPIVVFAGHKLATTPGTPLQRLKTCLNTTEEWKPSDPKLVEQYQLDTQSEHLCHRPLPCCSV